MYSLNFKTTSQTLHSIKSKKALRLLTKTKSIKTKKIYKQNILKIVANPQLIKNSTTTNNLINIYIKTNLNNMFITICSNQVTKTRSLSALGFKGKSKQTSYAYKMFAEKNINDILALNISNSPITVKLYIKTLTQKLKPFLKIYKQYNLTIHKIYDLTPIPYNGCRKKKISIKKKKKSVIKYLSYR